MKLSCMFLFFLVFAFPNQGTCEDHLIFSVAEDIPMGYENEVLRRNYYVNLGSNQGVTKGTTLTVFRVISKRNPYDNKKRVNYKIPIGLLEVIHTEDESSVGNIKKLYNAAKDPLFEINSFMIGDHVAVKVK